MPYTFWRLIYVEWDSLGVFFECFLQLLPITWAFFCVLISCLSRKSTWSRCWTEDKGKWVSFLHASKFFSKLSSDLTKKELIPLLLLSSCAYCTLEEGKKPPKHILSICSFSLALECCKACKACRIISGVPIPTLLNPVWGLWIWTNPCWLSESFMNSSRLRNTRKSSHERR